MKRITKHCDTYNILQEILNIMTIDALLQSLCIHKGTVERWLKNKRVPSEYFNDLNRLLNNKYPIKNEYRTKDQFYTKESVSKYCYDKTLKILKQIDIDTSDYTFIEPSAGCGNFYKNFPKGRRIGIDIDPKGEFVDELIKGNYLDYMPPQNQEESTVSNMYNNQVISSLAIDEFALKLKNTHLNLNTDVNVQNVECDQIGKIYPLKDSKIDSNINKELHMKNSSDVKTLATKSTKYIVMGNPPFGLRGNLALRFINHSSKFADVLAFILPPLFDSTGKGVAMSRVKEYKLAHCEKLPLNSFEYPDGTAVNIATIFQVWVKINTDKIIQTSKKTCHSFARVYSLSDGGSPSNTRNKKMLQSCDVYLPSTCFSGMKAYNSFAELPNKRGYGVVFIQHKEELIDAFFNKIPWKEVAFLSTNSAINLRTDLIENEIIKMGFYD